MKHRICVLVSALVLASCAGQDNLAASLPKLEGQPMAQVLARLGTPTEKVHTDSDTLYTWIYNQSGSFYTPNTASYPVVIQNAGHPTVAFTQPPMPSVANTYDWHCRLEITAKKGVIVHTAYQGNAAGCQTFSEKLKPLLTGAQNK
jgi:hypothetical protein